MDEILYLEPDEEITSVIDKIKNAKSIRIGLVVPKEATLLQSVVNLRLLQKEAQFLQKDISIVTTDKIGRNLAAQVGLKIFNSVKEEKPIYQPPPPTADPSEVIEIDLSVKNKLPEEVPGVSVHHFQENIPSIKQPSQALNKKPENQKLQSGFTTEKIANVPQAPSKLNINQIKPAQEYDKKILKKMLWPFIGLIFIFVLIALFLLLPKSTIIISVLSEDLQKSVDVNITNQIKTENIETNLFPGELIQVDDEKKESFSATGQKNVGTKAGGDVKLYNHNLTPYSLNVGSKLSSSSKTFITKSTVTAPGASAPDNPGTIVVRVDAENPGPEYNVKPGKFTIIGLSESQQKFYYCQSSEAMSGGTSRQVQIISQTDYDNAKNKIINELTISTQNKLKTQISDKKILDKALVIIDPQVTSSANIGAEADKFELTIKLTQQIMIFDYQKLKDYLAKILEKQIDNDKMVTIPSDNDIGIEIKKTAYDKGELSIQANINAKISSKIDANTIKSSIIGKSTQNATELIKLQPGVQSVTIDFWPTLWIKRIPNLEKNVNVKVEYVNK